MSGKTNNSVIGRPSGGGGGGSTLLPTTLTVTGDVSGSVTAPFNGSQTVNLASSFRVIPALSVIANLTGANATPTNSTIQGLTAYLSSLSGATSATAGVKGLVPAPAAGEQGKVLYGDGTWQNVPTGADFTQTPPLHVPVKLDNANNFGDSGILLVQDEAGGKYSLLLPENTESESGSISFGDVIKIGEMDSFLGLSNLEDGTQFVVLDSKITKNTGSSTPQYFNANPEATVTPQSAITSTLTTNPFIFTITLAQLQQINSIDFNVGAAMSNVRLTVKRGGKVIKHWPTKSDWYQNTGASWAVGVNTANFGTTQLRANAGDTLTVELRANTVSLRGNATTPYYSLKFQNGSYTTLATQSWVTAQIAANITGTYDPLNTTQAITASAAESRITALKSEIDAGTYISGWNASTNTPTLVNPPTNNKGEYYEVTTAATRFGIAWAVGDLIICGVDTNNNKVWYKRAYQTAIFDSRAVYVTAAGNDSNTGTIARPKATFSGGISVVAQPGQINFAPGSYTISSASYSKTNINLVGGGANGNNNVEFVGALNPTLGRTRVTKINITHGATEGFYWNDTTGSHHLQECSLIGSFPAISASSAARGFMTIASCDLTANSSAASILLANLTSGSATVYLTNTSGVRLSVGSGWTIYVTACPDIQIVNQAGTVIFLDDGNINCLSRLTAAAQYTALSADTNVVTDGYYLSDMPSPPVGARYDILLKRSVQGIATLTALHRNFSNCPPTIYVISEGLSYSKVAGSWSTSTANFANTDLTATASRTHNFGSNNLIINGNNAKYNFTGLDLKGSDYSFLYTGGAQGSSVAMYNNATDGYYAQIVSPDLRLQTDWPNVGVGKFLTCLDATTGRVGWVQPAVGLPPKVINQPIDKITQAGNNGLMILSKSKVYISYANGSAFGFYSGRSNQGAGYPQSYGFDNLTEVYTGDTGKAIDCGVSFPVSWVLYDNGNLYTWGGNASGQCGLGHTSIVYFPTLASTGVNKVYWSAMQNGYSYNDNRLIVRKNDGYIYGCGYNWFGQFGLGNNTYPYTLTQLPWIGQNPKAVFNLGSSYGCIIAQKSDGTLWFAGYDGYGQSGSGTAVGTRSTPINITAPWGASSTNTVKDCKGGFGYFDGTNGYASCNLIMLLDNSTTTSVRTVGANDWGAVGDGTTTVRYTPYSPNIGTGRVKKIMSLGGGPATIGALKENGEFWAWGHQNTWGAVGNNTTANVLTPALVKSDVADIMIDSWASHTNAWYVQTLTKDNSGYLFASGFCDANGYLGMGVTSSVLVPTKVKLPGKVSVVGVMSGDGGAGKQYLAMNDLNELYCWGYGGINGLFGYATHSIASPQRVSFGNPEIAY
jgi:alpha-tubulin suppressor-like RCC1 family protein